MGLARAQKVGRSCLGHLKWECGKELPGDENCKRAGATVSRNYRIVKSTEVVLASECLRSCSGKERSRHPCLQNGQERPLMLNLARGCVWGFPGLCMLPHLQRCCPEFGTKMRKAPLSIEQHLIPIDPVLVMTSMVSLSRL